MANRVELDEDTAVDETGCRIGESADLGQSVFEQLGVGVVRSTLEGRLIYVNARLCELLGYSRREALMLSIGELTHADDIGASVEARRHLAAGNGSCYEREVRLFCKDGHEIWARIVTSLVRSANGAAATFTSLVQDISRQKELESDQRETELRFRQLAENIREALFLDDSTDGRTLYVSPAYESIWGQRTSTLYANPGAWMDAIYSEDRPGVERALAAAKISGFMDHDYRIIRPDGTVR